MLPDYLDRLLATAEVGSSVTDWIGAIAMGVTAIIAVGALVFAWLQVREAKAARKLAQALEVQRAQPYVVVYTEESAATNLAIDLVVKNFGPTAAKDVRVQLEPWPHRTGQQVGNRVEIPAFAVLAPGQEWRTSWVWTPDLKDAELDQHIGSVAFTGIQGAKLDSPIVLDLNIYKARQWFEVHGIHDAAKALRDIRDNQKKWTEDVHGSLSVVTRDGEVKDARRAKRYAEWRANQNTSPAAQLQAKTPSSDEQA